MSNQIIKTHLNGDIFMKNCSFKYKNIEQKGVITTIILRATCKFKSNQVTSFLL